MVYILLGTLSFFILYWFDLAAARGIPVLKQCIWIVGNSLLAYSLVMICLSPERIELPRYLSYPGWVLASIFLLLLIYSLYLEIPFRSTYAARGSNKQLITSGTYALVRHPGVIWFILFLASLVLATQSKSLLIALPVWSIMDILYVVIQEKFFFTRIFGDVYKEYQKEVPMLIPTGNSLRRCLKTLRFS